MLLFFYISVVVFLIHRKYEWITSLSYYWFFTWIYSFTYMFEESSHQIIQSIVFKTYLNDHDLVLLLYLVSFISGFAVLCLGKFYLHQQVEIYEMTHKRVAARGIYAFIRHPQYLGLLLMAFSMVMNHLSIIMVVSWIGLCLAMIRLINKEESTLIELVNEEYVMYQKKSKKIIPKVY